MTDLAELERRVAALEAAHNDTTKSQRWMAATLGRIAAVQHEHTERLGGIENHLDGMQAEMKSMRSETKAMRAEVSALPAVLAETMREVLEQGKS